MYNNLTQLTFFGTSLASPIFASVITLINEERTAIGKGPVSKRASYEACVAIFVVWIQRLNMSVLTLLVKVGFVNPTLYKFPEVLNDIVNGSNPNCGSSGFKTAPGWDPVSTDLRALVLQNKLLMDVC